MNLPNALTLSRLVAIPVLIVLITAFGDYSAAAVVFLVFSLTDTLDGQLARRRGQVTELGKFLDPLADKLFILSVLIVLVQEALLPAWVVIIVFGRELVITILRSLSASQGRVISATPFGKTKTVTQTGAVLLLLLEKPYPILHFPAQVGVGVAVVFTVASGLDYVLRYRSVFNRTAFGVLPTPQGGAPGAESEVDPLVRELAELLAESKLQVATAESCTGGLVSTLITDRSGSSSNFLGGVVSYSKALKQSLLEVPADLLRSPGAVSEPVARAMAEGARDRLGADLAVAVTGVAGPEPDEGKPVGLTFVAVASRGAATDVQQFNFEGDRRANRRAAAEAALRLLIERIHVTLPMGEPKN